MAMVEQQHESKAILPSSTNTQLTRRDSTCDRAALLVLTATRSGGVREPRSFQPRHRAAHRHHQSDAGHHFLHARQRRKRKADGAIVVSGFFFLAILIALSLRIT